MIDKLKKEQFILQFLPESLGYLIKDQYVIYEDKKLKTEYLIDIIHNLILRFHFKRLNNFAINSSILKKKYGHHYSVYIRYLESIGSIILLKNYSKGKSCRIYKLDEGVLKSKMKRYRNSNKVLLKKRRINREGQLNDNIIPSWLKPILVNDLFSVEIDKKQASLFLDNLKDNSSVFNRNIFSVESIDEGDIFYHFDSYGRLHTNFTILKSFIRKNCLLIDGEQTVEIDIPNSQPLFLTILIKEIGGEVDPKELEYMENLLKKRTFYDFISQEFKLNDRQLAKKAIYKILFGNNHWNSKKDKMFSNFFPTIHNFIISYKKSLGDYRSLSHTLQKMESDFIFNHIVKPLKLMDADIKIITVHDSIIVKASKQKKIQDFFDAVTNDKFGI